MGSVMVGGVIIGTMDEFKVSDSLLMTAFNLTEEDQPPDPSEPWERKARALRGPVADIVSA